MHWLLHFAGVLQCTKFVHAALLSNLSGDRLGPTIQKIHFVGEGIVAGLIE